MSKFFEMLPAPSGKTLNAAAGSRLPRVPRSNSSIDQGGGKRRVVNGGLVDDQPQPVCDCIAVIEVLGAHYARGGEAAFDEAASRLVIAVCATRKQKGW